MLTKPTGNVQTSQQTSSLKKVEIITSPISTGSYSSFAEEIFSIAARKRSGYVCFANVHMLIEAYQDKSFRKVLENADILTPDGMPVAKAIKTLYGVDQDRVAGMDMLPSLLVEAAKRGKSVYFYGNTQKVLDGISKRIATELPYLDVRGYFSPPFRAITAAEDAEIVARINAAEPDLIFVALGCPKQENWMADHKDKLRGLMLGVGGAFNVYAGMQRRAPLWMQKLSMEWLYRLVLEPGRLWKRYFYTNSLFMWLFFQKYLSKVAGKWHPALF